MYNFFTKKSLVIVVSFLFFIFSVNSFSQCTAVIGSNPSVLEGCEIFTVYFDDLSAAGTVLSRDWDFGDGSPHLGSQNPFNDFSAGIIGDTTYIVKLTITCASGTSTAFDTVLVHKKPKVNFSSNKTTVCALTDSVCFTNNSNFGPGYSFSWNFSDGPPNTAFQPCHSYSTSGVYTVELTVTNSFGCSNSYTLPASINVIPPPNIDFTISSIFGCAPYAVTFTNTTDTSSNVFSSWLWNFGDGTPPVNGKNLPGPHTFTLPGTYFVSLSATNSLGCSNITSKGLIVRTTPTSTFNVNSPICVNESLPITYTGVAGINANYTWNFSGGIASPGTGQGPHNTYWANPGAVNVTLSVVDSGCTSVTSNPVIVNPLPIVQLTVSPNDTVCQNDLVTFTATPSSLVSYSFYNNSVVVQNSPLDSYSFSNFSSLDSVYVIGKNSYGCSNAKDSSIVMTVKPLPVVALGVAPPSICTGDNIVFTASPSSYPRYSFYHDFLLLQDSSSTVFTSMDWVSGYSVFVTASANGCTSNPSNSITPSVFQPLPTPQVNCGTSTDTTVEFTWLPVTGATGYLVSVDGLLPYQLITGTSEFIASLTLGDSASIRVIAVGPAPCGNSDTSAVHTCYANPCSAITFDINPYQTICSEDSLTLTLSNFNISPLNVSWNGGPYLPNNTDLPLFLTSDSTVNVSVSNPAETTCPPVDNIFDITVKPLPVVVLSVIPQGDSICEGTPLVFSASPAGFDDYSFFDGLAQIQSSNNPDYATSGLTTGNSIFVIPTNNGCTGKSSDSISLTVIQPLPAPQVNCGNTTTTSIQFTWNSIAGATGYQVSINGAAFISPSSGNNGTTHLITGLSPGDSATIIVMAKGKTPCGNSLPSAAQTCTAINCTAITFNFNPNQTICSGESVTLSLSGFNISNPAVSWNGVLSTSNIVTFVPSQDTVVMVSVRNPLEPLCGSVDNFFDIRVNPLPIVNLSISPLDDTTCFGTPIVFTSSLSGHATYSFYQGFLQLQSSLSNIYTAPNWINGYSVYVTATENGCTSNPSNSVTPAVIQPLPTPQVNCGTTTSTSVEFTWLPIPGATGYLVSENGATLFTSPSSGNNGTTHSITGLTSGSNASIRVIALGAAPCGNSDTSSVHSCAAINCTGITFNLNPNQTSCSGDSLTLLLSGINIPNPTVLWNGLPSPPNNADFTLSPTSNTTVNVAVSNPVQPLCPSVNNQFILNVKPLPVVTFSVAPQADSICFGTPLVFSASPAGCNYYSFYNGQSLIQNSNNPNYTTTSLTNGDSIFVIPKDNGCTGKSSDTIIKTVFQPLPTPQVNCGNTTSSGIQFTWNSITGAIGYSVSVSVNGIQDTSAVTSSTSFNVTGLSQGDAAAIVVTALGDAPCGNSQPSAIQTCYAINCSAVTFNLNPYQTVCSGDSLTLTLSGFNITSPNVSWNGVLPALSNNNSITLSPSNDTVVTVSVSDALQASCPSVNNFFLINVKPLPVVTLSTSQLAACSGSPIVFTASPLGFTTYSFFQVAQQLLQNSPANVYTTSSLINGNSVYVEATNNGCTGNPSNIISPVITQPLPTPQVNCGASTTSSVDFSWRPVPGATGYLISVNGGLFVSPSLGNMDTTELVTGLAPGACVTIQVIALGSAPCGNSATSPVHTCCATNCSAVTFYMNPYQTSCSGSPLTLTLSNFNIANPQVSWNGSVPANLTSTIVSPLTTDTVNIVVTNPQAGCPSISNYFIIQVNPKPIVTLSLSSTTTCQGVAATFSASPAGYSTYSFLDGGGATLQSSNNSNYISPNNVSGNLAVHVVTSDQGCSSTSTPLSLTILASPAPVTLTLVSPAGGSGCYLDTVIFSASPANYPNYTFYNGSAALQNSAASTLSVSSMSIGNTNNISVVATNAAGCKSNASDTLNFTVLLPPDVTLTCSDPDLVICSGNPVSFTALPSGMASYQFYNGTTLLQDSTINVFTTSGLQSGDSIYVTGTSTQGCESFQSNLFSLTVKPSPVVFISATDSTICAGTTVTLTANQNPFVAATSFQWSSTTSVDTFITVSPMLNTTYTLNSNLNGCNGIPATLLIKVDNNPPPVTNAGADATICIGDSISLSGSGGPFLYWTPSTGLSNPDISKPRVAPTTTTTYTLHTANLYCYSKDSVKISIDLCLSDITGPIPSCITPNGDGANDLFIIPNIDYFKNNSLVIYNRWGNIIYKVAPYLNDWDGKSKDGKDLTDGIYYYILDLGEVDNPHGDDNTLDKKLRTGYILIQR